jgi:hypothetical protein
MHQHKKHDQYFGKILAVTALVLLCSSFTFAQTLVRGTITDENGITLHGANFMVKGGFDAAHRPILPEGSASKLAIPVHKPSLSVTSFTEKNAD